MSQTAHSEVAPLRSVFLKSIAEGFVKQENIDENWKDLNYLARPDYKEALEEYAAFVNIIRKTTGNISFFSASENTGMDSIYCRDASIATDHGMIICNMGKGQRKGEPASQRHSFEKNGIKVLGTIEEPGCVEGGDVAWLDEKTLAVAHGYRTNHEGFRQLKALLQPFGIHVFQVFLPHYKGPSDVFHLMSIFSPVAEDLAVVYSPLMPVVFRNQLLDRGMQLVEVPEEEFESMGCNVLALAPKVCLMVADNPVTKFRLENAGCIVHEYKGDHISVMGGGGPTCLTRPIKRG